VNKNGGRNKMKQLTKETITAIVIVTLFTIDIAISGILK
jgi:hypothetical protein